MSELKIEHWILRNLIEYGNCSIPTSLIKRWGLEKVEEELTALTKKPVIIEKRENYDCTSNKFVTMDLKKKTKSKKYVLYIATVH